jgi:hypothetical protein
MKKIIFMIAMTSIPFSVSSAEMTIKEDHAIQGKIFAVKTAKKYSSVEGCTKIANSKNKVVGFTFDIKTQKCTLYKKVRSLKAKKGSVSGTK